MDVWGMLEQMFGVDVGVVVGMGVWGMLEWMLEWVRTHHKLIAW